MKIGILGCGNMGATLGRCWSQAGHQVLFASGQKHKAQELSDRLEAQWASYSEAVEECSVLLYTLRQVAPQQLCSRGWTGKTVIDCNQAEIPLGFEFRPRSRSLAQDLAEDLPLCQIVKAFCLHPVELYLHGAEALREWGVQTFYCGDSPHDKGIVHQLAQDLGLLPFDCGGLQRAHLLESQADFWRVFQLHQGQSLVSQFQLVGYPEPMEFVRAPSYDRHAAIDPKPLPIRESEAGFPPEF